MNFERTIWRTSNKDGETFTLESKTRELHPKGSRRVFLAYDERGESALFQDDVMRTVIHIMAKEDYAGSWCIKDPVTNNTARMFVV